MPVSPDLIGNRGSFFFPLFFKCSEVYFPFPFNSLSYYLEKRFRLLKKLCCLFCFLSVFSICLLVGGRAGWDWTEMEWHKYI